MSLTASVEVDRRARLEQDRGCGCIGCRGGGGGGDACDGGRHVVPGELSLPVGGVVHRLPGVNGAVQLPSNPGDADFRDLGLNLGGLLVDKGDGPLLPSPGAGRVVCRRENVACERGAESGGRR